MAEEAIEDSTHDFIADAIAASEDGDVLFEVQLNDTVYQKVQGEVCIAIGNCESFLSPNSGATEVEEFDGDLIVVVLVKVPGADKADRKATRTKGIAVTKALAKLFFDDPTMGGRVNDSRVMSCPRDWTSLSSSPYFISNLPLIVNETGQA